MSSSYLKLRHLGLAIGSACGLAAAATGHAAQTYVQPQMDLRVENNSNIDLDPDGSPDGSVEGYIADLQVLLGYYTQRGETSVRPRLRFQNYPDRDQREKTEGFLDWVTRYRWERSQFNFIASYAQEDSFNYDTRSGEFDPLDPTNPTVSGSGRFLTDETQTRVEVRPSYTFDITQRLSASFGGQWRTMDYDVDVGEPQNVDYDFWLANTELGWALDERTNIGVGGYISHYDVQSDSGDSDGYGIGLTYDRNWTEGMGVEVMLGYEVNDPTDPAPGDGDQRSSSVGGSIAAFGEGEVSNWRVFVGQRYAPNGNGRVRQIDQLRFQYDRDLTQRLTFRSAARYESQKQLQAGSGGDTEDTARLDLSLRWMLSRKWFVQGGYSYIWQQEPDQGDAYNNRFFLSGGYRGLARER